MTSPISRWLNSQPHYAGEKPGKALVAWLNDPQPNQTFVKRILADARVVCRNAEQYGSLRGLMSARKHKKLPKVFWKSHERLNETLATFIHAPQIDLHEFWENNPISWTIVKPQPPIDFLSTQLRWVLQVIAQGTILKIRTCEQCGKWYFARSSNQRFCSAACRGKHFSRTPAFKKKRSKYMRKYNCLKKSGKVK